MRYGLIQVTEELLVSAFCFVEAAGRWQLIHYNDWKKFTILVKKNPEMRIGRVVVNKI